ncbi:MAG TPA: MFS transporter [Sphingomonadaceae bacterium]|nr:MFS transporter [Sphingomonadaceae bacterium]
MAKGVDAEGPGADVPMNAFAIAIVLLCCIINVTDGLDFAALVQAAPVISRAWAVTPEMLGTLFAVTAIGMAVGAFVVAPQADRFGRRNILLLGLGLNGAAAMLSAFVGSVNELLVLRFLTGIGVGSLLANLNVLVIEYSNRKWGNFFLSIMHLCYSLGVVAASQVGFWFVADHGWEILFLVSGLFNLAVLASVFLWLPESMQFLLSAQPPHALERVNRLRRRLGHPPLAALPAAAGAGRARVRIADLVGPGMIAGSALLWLTALSYSIVSYYHLSWTPKVLDDAGLPIRLALLAGTFTSIASIFGNLSMGYFSASVGAIRLTTIYFAGAAAAFLLFGLNANSPYAMLMIAPIVSFFAQGAFSGMMINATRYYPPAMRSSGVGFVVGFGRFGAIAGPLMGGIALGAGSGLLLLYVALALIAAVAGVSIFLVGRLRDPARVPA